jgi:glycosyltransferase involved in cell wall biosynthesis
MKNLPKISVVIPSYNKQAFIGETLESIFGQDYPNLEIIVQDGGSNDGTLAIIKKYAERYPKQMIWESKKDKGQTDAINRGLRRARGDVLSYINADDVYKKGALLIIGRYFAKHPGTLWLAGKGEMIDKEGKIISSWATDYKNYLLSLNNYQLLLMVNYLMQPSVFLSREAYQKYGPFLGKKNVMEYELWLKLGLKEMPKLIDSYLSSFRLYKESISMSQFKRVLLEDERIVRKYTDNPVLIGLHWLHNITRAVIANIW